MTKDREVYEYTHGGVVRWSVEPIDHQRKRKRVTRANGRSNMQNVPFTPQQRLERLAYRQAQAAERNDFTVQEWCLNNEGSRMIVGWLAVSCVLFYPVCGPWASPEWQQDPQNSLPPFPPANVMRERLGLDELIRLYLQLDDTSLSGLSYRHRLVGQSGRAGAVQPGSPALAVVGTSKGHQYFRGKLLGHTVYASYAIEVLSASTVIT